MLLQSFDGYLKKRWFLLSHVIVLFTPKMNTKTIFTIVALLAAVVLTGTVMGTQYVNACHGKHGGHVSAMASSTSSGGGGMPSSGGTSSGGGGGGGGY
jgi:uncharacterized membrane protein YgcG